MVCKLYPSRALPVPMSPSDFPPRKPWKKASSTAFWANGMGCEVALRSGVGKMVLDVRPGQVIVGGTALHILGADRDRETHSRGTGFSARRHPRHHEAHRVLKEDANRATAVAEKRFPPAETKLIAQLVRRDLPYYDPTIPEKKS